MDISSFIKRKQKTPTRKTIIPWHCQKRYQASLDQLSFNQTITTACYSRKVSSLLENNKNLARELESSKCDLNGKDNLLLDNAKYVDIINFSRLKLIDTAENLRKVITNLDETISLLHLTPSKPPPKLKPFKINYKKEFKKQLKKVKTDTIEEETITEGEPPVSMETSELAPASKRTTKRKEKDSSRKKGNKQATVHPAKEEKIKKSTTVKKKCEGIVIRSSTSDERNVETTKSSKQKNKNIQVFQDLIKDVSEAVIPKPIKPKVTRKLATLSPTEISSTSNAESLDNTVMYLEDDSKKSTTAVENPSLNSSFKKSVRKSILKKPASEIELSENIPATKSKKIGKSNRNIPVSEPPRKKSVESNCQRLDHLNFSQEPKDTLKQKDTKISSENRNSLDSSPKSLLHRTVKFASLDEQQIEKRVTKKEKIEKMKPKIPKKRPLNESKQNILSNSSNDVACKKQALQNSVEETLSLQVLPDNKILVIAEVHLPPAGCEVIESCKKTFNSNLQPLVVLKDIFKLKKIIDPCTSTKVCEVSSTEQIEDTISGDKTAAVVFEDEAQDAECNFLSNQENNLSIGNQFSKKTIRRGGKVTSYKEPRLNKKMRRC